MVKPLCIRRTSKSVGLQLGTLWSRLYLLLDPLASEAGSVDQPGDRLTNLAVAFGVGDPTVPTRGGLENLNRVAVELTGQCLACASAKDAVG
jgi:hypothetical protein